MTEKEIVNKRARRRIALALQRVERGEHGKTSEERIAFLSNLIKTFRSYDNLEQNYPALYQKLGATSARLLSEFAAILEEAKAKQEDKSPKIIDMYCQVAVLALQDWMWYLGARGIPAVQKFADYSQEVATYLLSESRKAFARNAWQVSYEKARKAFYLLRDTKEVVAKEAWVQLTLDACQLLMACEHNGKVDKYNRDGNEWHCSESIVPYATEFFSLVLTACVLSGSSAYEKKYVQQYKTLAYTAVPLAWIRVGAEMVEREETATKFFDYLKAQKYRVFGCFGWRELRKGGCLDGVQAEADRLGKWLCEHYQTERVKKLVYLTPLLETVALSYAYRHSRKADADVILADMYEEDYLELTTLYLLWEYDNKKFHYYVRQLRYICLERHIETLYEKSSVPFETEMRALCAHYLALRDKNDASDPKNVRSRQIFRYRADE